MKSFKVFMSEDSFDFASFSNKSSKMMKHIRTHYDSISMDRKIGIEIETHVKPESWKPFIKEFGYEKYGYQGITAEDVAETVGQKFANTYLSLKWKVEDDYGLVEFISPPVKISEAKLLIKDLNTITKYFGGGFGSDTSAHIHIDRPKGFLKSAFYPLALALLMDQDQFNKNPERIGPDRNSQVQKWAENLKDSILLNFDTDEIKPSNIHSAYAGEKYYGINLFGSTGKTIEMRYPSSGLLKSSAGSKNLIQNAMYFSTLISIVKDLDFAYSSQNPKAMIFKYGAENALLIKFDSYDIDWFEQYKVKELINSNKQSKQIWNILEKNHPRSL